MAEVIRDEYDTGAPLLPVPLYAQTGDDRYGNAEKMIIKGVDVAPARADQQRGRRSSARPVRSSPTTSAGWSAGSATSPRRPTTGRGSTSTCTAAPGSRSSDATSTATRTSTPSPTTWPGSGSSRTPTTSRSSTRSTPARARPRSRPTARLRAALQARGSGVRIVVDEWCNTLDDVRAFVAAGAADVIHVKTPDLGGIGNTVRRCCWPATPGSRPSAAAPATRPTARPRSARTWRWPARPPRCWPSRAWAWTRDS